MPDDPPPDAPLTLREISRSTYRDVLFLKVADDQQRFVATNAQSLAQALFHEEAWFRGIYAGDTPVGFCMLECRPDKGEYALWRLMIDARYQRRGYGRRAVEAIVAHVRTLPGARELLLSHGQGPGNPGPFYESLGFTYTGEEDGGELIMRRALDSEE